MKGRVIYDPAFVKSVQIYFRDEELTSSEFPNRYFKEDVSAKHYR